MVNGYKMGQGATLPVNYSLILQPLQQPASEEGDAKEHEKQGDALWLRKAG